MVGGEDGEVAEPEPPAQSDPTGRWTRTNQVLGKGAFKVVYKGFDEQEGIEVAWNQIRMNELVSTKEDRERLYAEIRVLKQLKHKNIMTFHDSWLEQKGYTLNFITELFTSGTLRQYRKRHRSTDPEVMKRWAWQILCGLVYLHGHAPPIIHRDLKCDNIFINGSEGVVKIGDLGLATMLRARTAPQSVLGTPEFMAPELYDEEYDDRVDVYSFGMCMLELATLEYPYSECRNAAQIYRKVTLGVRPKALTKVANRELAEIISCCLAQRQERPRARQLLKHPYFDSIRNEKLALKLGQEALGVQDPSQPVPELSTNARLTVAQDGLANGSHPPVLDVVREEPEEETGDVIMEHSASDLAREMQGRENGFVEGPPPSATSPLSEDHDKREFKVRGRLQEHNNKLNLRLRIHQPDGTAKTVEFDFDLASDTALSVASEMVEEMSLSHHDAHKIAHAIKEEILSLTQHGSQPGSATHSMDSVSEDDSVGQDRAEHPKPEDYLMRQESSGTKYEGMSCFRAASRSSLASELPAPIRTDSNTMAQSRRSASVGDGQPNTPCSDSVTSVHDHLQGISPEGRSVPTRPHSSLGFHNSGRTLSVGSAPGSVISMGSPPAREHMASEPSATISGAFSPPPAREQMPQSNLPPKPNTLRPSESLLRHLGRTDSANHAQEMEALHQALADKNPGRLFHLPNEEDRRLPLMKLLENLEGSSHSLPVPASRLPPSAGLLPVNSQEMREAVKFAGPSTVRSASTLYIPEYTHSLDPASRGASPASSISYQDAVRDFQSQPNLSGMTKSEGSAPSLADVIGVSRAKSKADLLEARRQAAMTSLQNMESNCLEGLDAFGTGLKANKQKLPIRKLMGAAPNRAV